MRWQALDAPIAGWYTAVHGILVTAEFAGLVAVSFLLMRESANDFYGGRGRRSSEDE